MNIKVSQKDPVFSRIVAGCMNWGAHLSIDQSRKFIEECLAIGITTFDHADIYGHYTVETLFGNAIRGVSSIREQMQLVTKCGIRLVTPNRPENLIKSYKTSKEYIIKSVEQSLRNLQTDYIDMLLIHRPSPLMDPSEIAEAVSLLQSEGKVLHFGVSNFTVSQFEMLHSYIPLQTNQIEVSPLQLSSFRDGTLDQCLLHKIRPMAYSVLGGGRFFSQNPDIQIRRINEVLAQLNAKYNTSSDQIILAWILKHPSRILPIMGSTKIKRMQSAVKSLDIQLTDEEWFVLMQASVGEEVA